MYFVYDFVDVVYKMAFRFCLLTSWGIFQIVVYLRKNVFSPGASPAPPTWGEGSTVPRVLCVVASRGPTSP